MSKCWMQYLKIEKKYYGYCNFCGERIEGKETHYKMNRGKVQGYCLECWQWEFPDSKNPNKDTPLMIPNYDCNGRPLNLDTVFKTDFNINEFNE